MSGYWSNIKDSVQTLSNGMKLTLQHFWQAKNHREPVGVEDESYFEQGDGIMTLEYPYESLPVPDNGRYRLHNEVEDCIVCDKCAKICPVNCIDIEPIRAVEPIGETSDGTTKRIYAAKFDIDMAKCCFCGLCTTVCPTECLTMTKTYDFSEFDVKDHNYAFSEMTPIEILEKKKLEEEMLQNKLKAQAEKDKQAGLESKSAVAKPKMKPKMVAKVKPVAKPRPMIRKKPPEKEGDE